MILRRDSPIYRRFGDLIRGADRAFFAGLPGVGKSLLLQQLALMARDAGRQAHLVQWDTARQPFESAKYPLEEGATHPMVIKATGAWLRLALVEWEQAHRASNHMLIGEVPLIGGRLMEIARPAADEAEALLADRRTQFILPVPSREVRAIIEARRERTIAEPRHDDEAHDAPPDLLRALWQDLLQVAGQLGLSDARKAEVPYSPQVYEAVYRHLLRHRHVVTLRIDQPLNLVGSVYDFEYELPRLVASREQAKNLLTHLENTISIEQVQADAARWFEL